MARAGEDGVGAARGALTCCARRRRRAAHSLPTRRRRRGGARRRRRAPRARGSGAVDDATARIVPPAPLPPGWRAAKDPATGRRYYWEAGTRTVTWERPRTPRTPRAGVSAAADAAAGAVANRANGLGRAYKNAVTAVGRPGLFLYSKAVGTSAAHKKLVAKNRERHAKWLGKELPPEPDSPGLLVAFFGLALIAAAL